MKYESNFLGKPPGLWRKLVALIGTVALIGLVLMFSAVLFSIILVAGTIVWVYLWWKTRELRKLMRDFAPRAMEREQMAGEGAVFEGEVIRVVDSQHER